jgi:osmotically-inducible protein OsmY
MKGNAELATDVLSELELERRVDVAASEVSAQAAVVTLTGLVSGAAEKLVMERAAKSLAGAQGLADEIEVKPVDANHATDTDLAAAAVEVIECLTTVPTEGLMITARDGWLELGGAVDGKHQRDTVEDVTRHLAGVKGVINSIVVKSNPVHKGAHFTNQYPTDRPCWVPGRWRCDPGGMSRV